MHPAKKRKLDKSKASRKTHQPSNQTTFSLSEFGFDDATTTEITVDQLSQDGRRILSRTIAGPSLSPIQSPKSLPSSSRMNEDPIDHSFSSGFTWDFAKFYAQSGPLGKKKVVKVSTKKKFPKVVSNLEIPKLALLMNYVQDNAMKNWRESRNEVLAEMIRGKGRGSFTTDRCPSCEDPEANAAYRCMDCFTPCLVCRNCVVNRHGDNPLHHLEVRFLLPR